MKETLTSKTQRGLRIVLSVALVLAGCTSREAQLTVADLDAPESPSRTQFILPEGVQLTDETEVISPQPGEAPPVDRIDADHATDFVHFRFDVSAEGQVSNIRVIASTNDTLAVRARQILKSWEFTPASVDGVPVETRDIEARMEFAENLEPGATVGFVALLIVLIPVVLVFAILTDPSGHMKIDVK